MSNVPANILLFPFTLCDFSCGFDGSLPPLKKLCSTFSSSISSGNHRFPRVRGIGVTGSEAVLIQGWITDATLRPVT